MTKTGAHINAPRATVAMGAAGAIVGGAIAAARDYEKVRNNEMTREAAVKDVLKESGTTGLATATATAVVGAMGFTGILSLAGIVCLTAGTKHLVDKMLDAKCGKPALPAGEAKEETPPAEDKTAGKKAKDVSSK